MDGPAVNMAPKIEIGQFSSPGRKTRNDDSYGVLIPDGAMLASKGIAMAIADGMSTSHAAKEASESCVKSFLTDYYATHESWTVKTSVARVLVAVNRWLYGQGQTQYLSDRGMVSTFSGLILKGASAHVFHAGDTRISLLRENALEQLTEDHRIRVSRKEEVLSRAFGISPELEVDCRVHKLMVGDVVLFTTDGVHDFVTDKEFIRLIGEYGSDLDGAAKALCDLAFEANSPDNLTVQLVRVEALGKDGAEEIKAGMKLLPFPPDLDPGDQFEGYEIIREIHASAKSQLYLVKDMDEGGMYVLKTPSVNYEDDLDYIEHFTRESWIGRTISSPHVVRVIKPKLPPRFLYHVLEHVEGETLSDWMHRNPQPQLYEVRQIVSQTVKGLRAFHRKEILHQDLKPDNLIIDKNGTVKLIDFGSAHVGGLEENGSRDFNKRGTVNYIAPEYHHPGQAASNRSDIFALGVIAYQMLTGELPYGRGFASKRHTEKLVYREAHLIRDDIPYWMSKALARAVEKNPRLRYSSLSAFETDLERPNPNYKPDASLALLQKNPEAFWRFIALVLAGVNIVLILKLLLG